MRKLLAKISTSTLNHLLPMVVVNVLSSILVKNFTFCTLVAVHHQLRKIKMGKGVRTNWKLMI
jgi:hypothetical protein